MASFGNSEQEQDLRELQELEQAQLVNHSLILTTMKQKAN
jgi:hypothetical protein